MGNVKWQFQWVTQTRLFPFGWSLWRTFRRHHAVLVGVQIWAFGLSWQPATRTAEVILIRVGKIWSQRRALPRSQRGLSPTKSHPQNQADACSHQRPPSLATTSAS